MKKTLFFAFVMALSTMAFSQVNPNTLGIRIGGGNSFGAEVSYQRGFSNINRLEVDLGLKTSSDWSGFNLAGAYQWVWNIEGGFNWYAGPGAQIGSWSYKSGHDGGDDGFYLGILGQVGIEYIFSEVPIQISIDTRPTIGLIGYSDDSFNIDLALGIRYVF